MATTPKTHSVKSQSKDIKPKDVSDNTDTSSTDAFSDNYDPDYNSVIDYSAGLNARPPSTIKLIYDIVMLGIIILDLLMISLDLILMSGFAQVVSKYLGFGELTTFYAQHIHHPLRVVGGGFTIFLIIELLIRWALSIINKEHVRWFFFPFIHWYEVLGCFPQLRALRLLRAVVIGRRLYQLGYRFLPESWLASAKFYYELVLEELADRVILTATDNLRQQFSDDKSNSHLLKDTLDKNREAVQLMLASMLRQEILPHIKNATNSTLTKELSLIVGQSVQDTLANTPEISRYLRLIPIAGSVIEGQMLNIGQHVGENLVTVMTDRLLHPDFINEVIDTVSASIAQIEVDNSELDSLIGSIVADGLTAFEQQVRVQQWKHSEHLKI